MAATAKLSEPIETRLFINNETFEVVYPYTKEVVANVQEAEVKDVNDAVSAAQAAFPTWRDLGVEQRGRYLRKVSELFLEAKFIQLFHEKFAAVTAGDPLDPATSHGPQIDAAQYSRVQEYLGIGEKDGSLTLGGDAKDGFFVKPTIFERVPEDSRLMREEVFGPVVAINTFKTEAEAIEKANNTEFGLYASVFTKDLDRAIRLSKALEAGVVAVNCTSPTSTKDAAFGGYKMSGTGVEGLLYSVDNFLQTKSILIKTGQVGGPFG